MPHSPTSFARSAIVLATFLFLVACGSEQLPAADRPGFPQPTFVSLEVGPAPVSPTATPWPNLAEDGVRMIQEGSIPERYSPAEPGEVVNLWTQFLTGSAMQATSGDFLPAGVRILKGNSISARAGQDISKANPEGWPGGA